jgi:O-methyltransferase
VQSRSSFKTALRGVAKEASRRSGLYRDLFFAHYPYMQMPDQLVFLTACLEDTRDVEGVCVEVGCARGATTVFLNRYMGRRGIDRPYVAIDTFSGFVEDDVRYEIETRGKPSEIRSYFADNRVEWFEETVRYWRLRNVRVVRADATSFDFACLGGIAFALLDVDLYKATRAILPRLYERLGPGGIVVVDDCTPDQEWDGAYEAYVEFTSDRGLSADFSCEGFGVVRRPPAEPSLFSAE